MEKRCDEEAHEWIKYLWDLIGYPDAGHQRQICGAKNYEKVMEYVRLGLVGQHYNITVRERPLEHPAT